MTASGVFEAALAALRAGLNVLPPEEDGTKQPAFKWTKYETQRVTEEQLRAWYRNGRTGVGVLCGEISGNLELFEFDEWDAYEAFVIAAREVGLADLADRIESGYAETTPGDGVHWLLRCPNGVGGNTKLARRPKQPEEQTAPNDKTKVLIETRGEGGYCITAPSHGTVHPTGQPYRLLHGGFDSIAVVTSEERHALHDLARSFDRMPKVDRAAPTPPKADRALDGNRPGDDFNERATWAEILEPHGWVQLYTGGDGTTYWRRPGKPGPGPSATTDHNGTAYLYVFSTSTGFEAERGYSKFSAHALLNHGGDVEAAARALAERGFGDARSPRVSVRRDADDEGPVDLFRRWTMPELLDAERMFKWRVRGILVDPTYGMLGGDRKVLKSHVLTFLSLATASGVSLFDQFVVDEAAPVVVYVGEGGRVPWTNRAERIAAAMGIGKLREVPLHPLFETAPVGSLRFKETLERDLAEVKPGLVVVDPWYAFHGAASNASNLFEEGALLTSLSTPCLDAGSSLIVASHFKKTGTGRGLDRITQSGGQEWSDTWLLLSHRTPPDVDGGHFSLLLEVGSRQWGGSTWELDLELGRFDQDLGEFDGAIDWELRRHRPGHEPEDDTAKLAVLERLADMPWTFTKTEVLDKNGAKATSARAAFDALAKAGKIVAEPIQRIEGDRKVKRSLWATADQPRPTSGPGSTELAL